MTLRAKVESITDPKQRTYKCPDRIDLYCIWNHELLTIEQCSIIIFMFARDLHFNHILNFYISINKKIQ